MPKVSEEYRDAKRREITDAAQRAIVKHGFGASMAEIIAESGLSAGAIYGHFDGKAEIFVEVASRILGRRIRTVQHLADASDLRPPGALVRSIVEGWMEEIVDPRSMVQVWGHAVTEPAVSDVVSGVVVHFLETIGHYISLWHQREHDRSPEEADAIGRAQAPLLLATCQGFILQRTLLTPFDEEAYLDSVERYFPR